MRISDWSSDVCSSDLFTVCQAAVWRTPDGHWCSTCSDRFYVDLAARRLVYTSPVRDEEAGGSMLRVIKYVKRGYSIQVDSLGRVIDRIVSAVRSEEHTSELQSLMRISYAVFCLKKKRNIKLLTSSHIITHPTS